MCVSVHIFPCAGAETEIPPAPATCSNFLSCTTAFFIRINHEALFASPLLSWKLLPFTINEVPRPYKWPEYLAWSILSSKNICEQAKNNNKILVQKRNIKFSYVGLCRVSSIIIELVKRGWIFKWTCNFVCVYDVCVRVCVMSGSLF